MDVWREAANATMHAMVYTNVRALTKERINVSRPTDGEEFAFIRRLSLQQAACVCV